MTSLKNREDEIRKTHQFNKARTEELKKGINLFPFPFSDMGTSISEFGLIHCCSYWFQSKINNRMANSVDSDETAHEPSHLDLHCLQRYLYWSAGMKG